MRNTLLVIIFLSLFPLLVINAQETNPTVIQTNLPAVQATNILSHLGVSSNIVTAVSTTLGYLVDEIPYIQNGDYLVEMGGLKHGSHWGGLLDFQVPINTNSWQFTYGFALAYIDGHAYSGAFNISLGKTITPPLIGNWTGPFYTYAESGPGYNFEKNQMVVQSFIGVKYQRTINESWNFIASYGYGNISDISGNLQAITLGFTYKLGVIK